MSATRAPAFNFASTPSSDGIHDEIRFARIVRPEKPLCPFKQIVMMLVPADAVAALERRANFRFIVQHRRDDLKCPRDKAWAVVNRQRQSLFRRQRKSVARSVVRHVAARRLSTEPFAHVPLACAGFRCQFTGGHGPRAVHRFVQPKPVPEQHQRGVHRRPHIHHRLPHELIELRFVNRRSRRRTLRYVWHTFIPSHSGRFPGSCVSGGCVFAKVVWLCFAK